MQGSFHHVDFNVTDIDSSRSFYDLVLTHMGYKEIERRENGITYWGLLGEPFPTIGIGPSRGENANRRPDRRAPGMNHFAWRARSSADVDALHAKLVCAGATILGPPGFYYGPAYYAVFFADPDGLKLEYVWTSDLDTKPQQARVRAHPDQVFFDEPSSAAPQE